MNSRHPWETPKGVNDYGFCSATGKQHSKVQEVRTGLDMKQFLSAMRLALYVVAIPLTISTVASAHQWLGDQPQPEATETVTTHVVRLNDAGMIRGIVKSFDESGQEVAVSNANASLIKDGELVAKVKTGIDGLFSIADVEPGVYSFVASGSKGLATFGMQVVDSESEAGVPVLSVLAAPPKFSALETIIADVNKETANTTVVSDKVIGGAQQVRLTLSGSLVGNVDALNGNVDNNEVVLIQNDQVIAKTNVVADGEFEIPNVQPGLYTFVAHGEGGLATVAMEVVAADYQANLGNGPVYTSLKGLFHRHRRCCNSVAISMVPACETVCCEEIIVEECAPVQEVICEEVVVDPVAAPVGGCCGAGGYGGYGGYGGGGMGGFNLSGVGDLIGLGIGAWVLTEVIDQIDNNNIPTPVPVPTPPQPASGFTYVYL